MKEVRSLNRMPMTVVAVGNVRNASQPSLGSDQEHPHGRGASTVQLGVRPNPGLAQSAHVFFGVLLDGSSTQWYGG